MSVVVVMIRSTVPVAPLAPDEAYELRPTWHARYALWRVARFSRRAGVPLIRAAGRGSEGTERHVGHRDGVDVGGSVLCDGKLAGGRDCASQNRRDGGPTTLTRVARPKQSIDLWHGSRYMICAGQLRLHTHRFQRLQRRQVDLPATELQHDERLPELRQRCHQVELVPGRGDARPVVPLGVDRLVDPTNERHRVRTLRRLQRLVEPACIRAGNGCPVRDCHGKAGVA